MKTFITIIITSIIAGWIGIDIGLNTNSIKYLGVTTSPSPLVNLEIVKNGEMHFTKFPIDIYYSQGGDTPSEKRKETGIYAAVGTLDYEFPGEVGSGDAYAHLNFHAYIARGNSGIYASVLTIIHPYNEGVIQLENGHVIFIAGNEKEQVKLKTAAQLILNNL